MCFRGAPHTHAVITCSPATSTTCHTKGSYRLSYIHCRGFLKHTKCCCHTLPSAPSLTEERRLALHAIIHSDRASNSRIWCNRRKASCHSLCWLRRTLPHHANVVHVTSLVLGSIESIMLNSIVFRADQMRSCHQIPTPGAVEKERQAYLCAG